MANRNRESTQTQELLDFQTRLRSLQEVVRELSKIDSVDEFCRMTVELGRRRLGFDRVGLWFLTPDHRALVGSYGTDESGQVRDERHEQHDLLPEHLLGDMLTPGEQQTIMRRVPLLNGKTEVVGYGDCVRGNLWDGDTILGWLDVDNLIRQEPWTENQIELVGLYAATIGYLISRKRIERDMRAKEEENRRFLDKLKALHEVTTELSQTRSFDDLCFRAVELGCGRLGFDRLGLWFLDADPNFMTGSFGSDEVGGIRDERAQRLPVMAGEHMREMLDGRVFAATRDDVPLYGGSHEVVGYGWNAVAQMWDRDRNVGWVCTDNLLSHQPVWDYDLELLSLFADTLGHLATVRRAEEALVAERTLLRTIIDTVPDPIYVKDLDSRFILVNKACWDTTPGALNEDDLIGKCDFDIFPHRVAEIFRAADQLVMTSGMSLMRGEESGRPQGDQPTTLLTTKVPLKDAHGRVTGLVGVSHDVSELKRIERQTLELAVERERVKVLRESITSISHDLRTPLSTIKSLLYVLERVHDPAQQKARLDNIALQTEVLEHRIRELLYSARLENASEIVCCPVHLTTISACAVQNLRLTLEHRQLTLAADLQDDLPTVLGDEVELRRVIDNLIQNAITYTPDGGTITVRTYTRAGNVAVEVADTGIGISEDHLPYIFDHFYRVDKSRSMNQEGMGLGLAIVKRIVAMHDGIIQVESIVGQGSVFRVLLPMLVGQEASGDS